MSDVGNEGSTWSVQDNHQSPNQATAQEGEDRSFEALGTWNVSDTLGQYGMRCGMFSKMG